MKENVLIVGSVIALFVIVIGMIILLGNSGPNVECIREREMGYYLEKVVTHYETKPQTVVDTDGKIKTRLRSVPVYETVRGKRLTTEEYKQYCR